MLLIVMSSVKLLNYFAILVMENGANCNDVIKVPATKKILKDKSYTSLNEKNRAMIEQKSLNKNDR